MGDESTPSTLTQVNAEFLNNRAARLDSAITKALASKIEAPKPPKASRTASSPASSTAAATPAAATPASTETSEASQSEPDEPSSPATDESPTQSADSGPEPQDGAAEAEQTALDRPALEALAKKKDRRGIEKLIGLPEGSLGVGDHDYAAFRRRVGELETREATVAATHERNNQTLIAKFGGAVEAIERAQKGDLHAYARSIELTTGIRIATFIEHYAKNVQQLDPRILQLEQENARLRGQTAPTPQQDAPAPAGSADAARKKADTYIAAEAKEHPALKLKDGAKDVREKWLGSFDKSSQSFKLTPKQAADAVVADRRKAREQEDWVLSGKKPPPKPRTRTVSRTGASESQPRKQNLTREQLIDRAANEWRRQKARAQ